MKRLLLIAAGLWLTLVVLCFVAIGRGRAEPMEEIVEGLGWCEGRLCFMGIVPGKTSWDEARTILTRSGGAETEIGIALDVGSSAKILMWSRLGDFDKQVNAIEIYFQEGSFRTLGSLISGYGTPCAVALPYNLNIQTIEPLYKSFNFTAVAPGGSQQNYASLDPNWPVQYVQLFDFEHGCEGPAYRSWRGFASLRSYARPQP